MPPPSISHFVFDVESVADGALVSKIRYPGEGLSSDEALARYRELVTIEAPGTLDGGDWNDELEAQLTAAVDEFKSTGTW